MPPSLTLYGGDLSPFTMRVVLQMAWKGREMPLTLPEGGRDTPEYRAIHPLGKFPALEADGEALFESGAICDYLERVFPEPSLLPAEPLAHGRMRAMERLFDIYLMNAMLPLFPMLSHKARVEAVVAPAVRTMAQALDAIEPRIGARWLMGDAPTLADCIAVPVLLFVERFPPMFGLEPFDGRPALAAYWARAADDAVAGPIVARMKAALALYAK